MATGKSIILRHLHTFRRIYFVILQTLIEYVPVESENEIRMW